MKSKLSYVTAAVSIVLLAVSCQKAINSKSENAALTAVSQSDATTFAARQSLVNSHDALEFGLATGVVTSESIAKDGSCPPVTTYNPSPDVYPHTKTVDWGTGCTTNGLTRSGKVIFSYTGDMSVVGSSVTTTYDNFYENGIKYEGSQRLVHNKTSPFTQAPVFVLQQLDRKVIQPNGDYTIFGGTRRLAQWADSSGDPGFPHGWFRVTGNITGNEMKGSESYQYTSTIDALNPLVYRNCAYIVQGKLHVEFTNGQSPWDVDYGKARTCDDLAELTIDGVTTTVNLPLEP